MKLSKLKKITKKNKWRGFNPPIFSFYDVWIILGFRNV